MTKAKISAGRFAPTPSGLLHLGSLRTALLAWLFSRSRESQFYLRIEDADATRAHDSIIKRQLTDLSQMGIHFDPYRGHPYVRQAERTPFYEEAFKRIQHQVFPCYCTRSRLLAARREHHYPDEYYPGFCLHREGPAKGKHSLRFQPPSQTYRMHDALLGPQTFEIDREHGPFIVKRNDGFFAYAFAVIVDDIAMGVTEVVRGADILPSTGQQLSLYEAFGQPPPLYAHVPLILSTTGKKFSKSEGALDLASLQERGISVHQLLGLFAYTVGIIEHLRPITQLEHLLTRFDPSQLILESTYLDPASLSFVVGEGIRHGSLIPGENDTD